MEVDHDAFELELDARPDSVARVRTTLLAWLAERTPVPASTSGAIALTVSEAVSNAARHAYENESGTVAVGARLEPGRLDLRVEDSGQGFSPGASRDGDGLGLMIITRLADEVALRSDSSGTELKIRFDLGGGGGHAPAPPIPGRPHRRSRGSRPHSFSG